MLDEKDLPLDLTPDLTPEDDLITDLPGEIEILESPDIPVVIDKEEEVGVLLEEEIALETLVEADDYSGPHDEFDWTITNRNAVNYSPEETKRLLAEYDSTFNSIHEGQVLQGKVASIVGSDVVFDIRFKSDGLIPLSEFRDLDLKPGDLVEIYVERTEDEQGHLVLSRKKAKLLRAWEILVDSYKNGTIIKGNVISKTKGGLIVDCNGLETFLPGSQIDIKPIVDYDAYVGKTMEFKVVKINETIKNAVVSHKALIEGDLQEQREQIISGLEKGQVLEGTVKNITDFGAFLDLGGVDGLLYITDISWGRISHPSEVLEKNQKINVVVLDFDENKKRISLGLKQLQPHPWDVIPADIVEGSTVKGKIVNIEDYGAFLEIYPGVEGLIHVSEVNWNSQPINAKDFFFLGQEFEAKVGTIDREERKMSLSLKQLVEDPWTHVQQNFSVGTRHTGVVKNLTPYGVFVELSEGIGGMVHISDLSWTKRYNHPSEYTKVGQNLDVLITDIDLENRKLSLGHKQLEENPWDTFESIFPEGSYHEATVLRKDDRGFTVQLPYGLEAYAPVKFMKKENNLNAAVDETLTVKVIEFNREEKKIIVSHTRYLEDIRKEADDNVKKEKDVERQVTKKAVEKIQTKVEMSTLGEIEGFSQLKEQLQESAKAKLDAKAEAKANAAPAEVKVEATEKSPKNELFETSESEAEVKPKAKAKAKSTTGDDLKIIEGIGPKIAELLNADGINTFEELANAEISKIQTVLDNAGSRYRMHDPSTWPQQARLAFEGKMDELKVLQDSLKGGKA
ncbi:MAG: 30S ribosomal protein S1 [Saprospiraceae bacterium]|jgi:small subunit ribosomal protein S1|uniref:Small ribosomal subunit protein bS1 n=1 Tax=Candidatus Defluviibacterium haderslevense TaxID=2981993 RepID=A0A9D7XH04_9BACT|nr:30S ribosomal protein S1 [Candidatus Defluviibacterium haderslevense]MBL0238264.1 30S ribosomal protein S1 [Candidatus Defluviibacterium haderslevense]MCC7026686.1 30S ribosomal protein S1 [Saprospiraceae bacterium]